MQNNAKYMMHANHLLEDWQYANGRKLGHATGPANNNIRNNMTSTHQA